MACAGPGPAGKGCPWAGTLPRGCQAVPGVGSVGRGWDGSQGRGTPRSTWGQGGAARCAALAQRLAGMGVCHPPPMPSNSRGTHRPALPAPGWGTHWAPGHRAHPSTHPEPCAPKPPGIGMHTPLHAHERWPPQQRQACAHSPCSWYAHPASTPMRAPPCACTLPCNPLPCPARPTGLRQGRASRQHRPLAGTVPSPCTA